MTIRDWVKDYCVQRGMFDDQAEAVVEMVTKDKVNDAMQGRWTHAIDGYPPTLLAVLVLSINENATRYIEENLPFAWFKPLFDSASGND